MITLAPSPHMSIAGLINFEIFIFFTNKIIFEDSIFSLHWGIFNFNNNNNNNNNIENLNISENK
jgi:hypothetical protein